MVIHKLLKDNGWEVECESPLEIRHEDGGFASLYAAQCIVNELQLEKQMRKLHKAKKAYLKQKIDRDAFIKKILKVL